MIYTEVVLIQVKLDIGLKMSPLRAGYFFFLSLFCLSGIGFIFKFILKAPGSSVKFEILKQLLEF